MLRRVTTTLILITFLSSSCSISSAFAQSLTDQALTRIDTASRLPAPWYVRDALASEAIRVSEGGASLAQTLRPTSVLEQQQLLNDLQRADARLTVIRLDIAAALAKSNGQYGWVKDDLGHTASDLFSEFSQKQDVGKRVGDAVDRLRRDVGRTLRRENLTTQELSHVREAVVKLADARIPLSVTDLTAARQTIEATLSAQGKSLVDSALATATNQSSTLEVPRAVLTQAALGLLNPSLTPVKIAKDEMGKVLSDLGTLRAAGDTFTNVLLNTGDDAQRQLTQTLEKQQKEWGQIRAAIALGPVTKELDDKLRQVEPFLARVNMVAGSMTGDDLLHSPASVRAIRSVVGRSIGADAAEAVDAVVQIGQAKNAYVAGAAVVLNSLAAHSPELKQLTGTVSQVAQFMQVAGPLIGLASMTTGVGAVAALGSLSGGFGGGSSGPDPQIMAALAGIQESLNRIEGKLDEALVRLRDLQEDIRRNHEEVMSALESLGYDVERTRVMLQDFIDTQNLKACAVYRNDPSQHTLVKLSECSQQLSDMYFQDTAVQSLSVRLRYANKPGAETALQQAKTTKTNLARLLTAADGSVHLDRQLCGLLRQPVGFYSDLITRPSLEDVKLRNDVDCVDAFNVDDFVDPGVLSGLILSEQDALRSAVSDAAKQGPQAIGAVAVWWKANSSKVRERWRRELDIINLAVTQQSLLGGDFLLSALAQSWGVGGKSFESVHDLFVPGNLLADNAFRVWVYDHVNRYGSSGEEHPTAPANDSGGTFAYAVAYNMPAPHMLVELLGPPEGMAIQRAPRCPSQTGSTAVGGGPTDAVWIAKTANVCFPLPTPAQVESGELRISSPLRRLLTARSEVLGSLEGILEAERPDPVTRKAMVRARAMSLAAKQASPK